MTFIASVEPALFGFGRVSLLLISLSACYFVLFRVTRGHPRKSSPYGFAAEQKHEDEHFSGEPGLSHFRKSVGGGRRQINACEWRGQIMFVQHLTFC